jgi:fibronectin type 3 domain-containing protein
VENPVYITNAIFDFGTATSPLMTGALRVSETTLIADSYGWVSLAGLLSRDRGAANTNELRDFILSPSTATFKVYVQNGSYHITVKQGDATYAHDNMKIEVNGSVAVPSVTSAINTYVTSEFDVTTSNNALEFTFSDGGGTDVNWVLNSLQLKVNSLSAIHNLELNELNEFGSNSNVSIIDMTGKIIREEKLGNQKYYNLINQKNIAKGIYLLKINDSNKSKVIKVVKAD